MNNTADAAKAVPHFSQRRSLHIVLASTRTTSSIPPRLSRSSFSVESSISSLPRPAVTRSTWWMR